MYTMRFVLLVFSINLIVYATNAKIYDRCELVQELVHRHKVSEQEAGVWACIADKQSNYNTAALGGSKRTKYHGIFQISDEYWCSPPGKGTACGISCGNLRDDDITDDLNCARDHIYLEHRILSGDGFNAWPIYKQYCRVNAPRYTQDCDLRRNSASDYKPTKKYIEYKPTYQGGAKVYEPCELANELLYKHALPADQIATWVCIAKYESLYNTSAIGSGDYGLFQISELYWCGKKQRGKACNLACSELLDNDITNDVKCLKQIYEEHNRLSGNGFTAWSVYKRYCKGDVSRYISNCFNTETNNRRPEPVRTTSRPTYNPPVTRQPVRVQSTTTRRVNYAAPINSYASNQKRPSYYNPYYNAFNTPKTSRIPTRKVNLNAKSGYNLIEYYLKLFNNRTLNSIKR